MPNSVRECFIKSNLSRLCCIRFTWLFKQIHFICYQQLRQFFIRSVSLKKFMRATKIPKDARMDQHLDINRYKNRMPSIFNAYYQANLLQIVDQLPEQAPKQPDPEHITRSNINEAIGMAESEKNEVLSSPTAAQISLTNVVMATKHECDALGNDTFINTYQISKTLLGKGSHSQVRLARREGKNYAIKIISYDRLKKRVIIKDQQITKMVNSEINLLIKLKCPYVIGFEEAIYLAEKQRIFIVLEYCSKGPLTKFISSASAMPFGDWIKKAKKFLLEIAMGIKKMHDSNIIHRDIKSENVLINQKDEVRIIDFNISCEIPPNGMITLTDKFVGTKTYAPPELVIPNQKTREVDGRLIDIWALGITFLEFLERKHPFNVSAFPELIKLVQSPVQLNRDFPPELKDLMQKMLRLDNKERIQIGEVVAHPWFRS